MTKINRVHVFIGLNIMGYAEDLQHPKWQRKRLEIMRSADWKCSACKADDKTLHVHHKRYIKGRKPWEYKDSDLICLCKDCHHQFHAINDWYKDLEADKKERFLLKILGESANLVRRGPFAFTSVPNKPNGCLIIHVPSCSWRVFTLSLSSAVSFFDSEPNQRAELLKMLLE